MEGMYKSKPFEFILLGPNLRCPDLSQRAASRAATACGLDENAKLSRAYEYTSRSRHYGKAATGSDDDNPLAHRA